MKWLRGLGVCLVLAAAGGPADAGREPLGRGLVVRPLADGNIYVGWRLLKSDRPQTAFNLYRRTGSGPAVKINAQPLRQTTDLIVPASPANERAVWFVRPIVAGREGPASAPVPTGPPGTYVTIRLQGDYTFQKVGIADLDGDRTYDFVIKQPGDNIDPWHRYWKRSPDTYKLEAYTHDGRFLWRYDLGWAIERGIWYSPYLVYDLDGDGKAEVAVKTGEGDPREPDGRVRSGPEYLTILDGLTGKPIARVAWPSRDGFKGPYAYNYYCRNQIGLAFLDGERPCLIVERGTYNIIKVVAYEFRGRRLHQRWRWDNTKEPRRFWGQGAHWMHCADVDGDGRDEVLLGSAALDDDGSALWSTGLGHPDHFYLGEIDPGRPGLEVYYGIETRQRRNGMCLVDARTGRILWGHDQPTRHIHSSGLCSDIDPRHPGWECYSGERDLPEKRWLRDCKGNVLVMKDLGGLAPRAAFWDADRQRELLAGGRISDYEGANLAPRIQGHIAAIADILGDWREEIITSVRGELRIYTTTIPATDRRPCLMQDPVYRTDVAHAAMGYFQVPMLSRDPATTASR